MEWPREQILQAEGLALSLQIDQNDFNVSADLPQHLAARSAGRRQRRRIRSHRNAPKLPRALGDGLERGRSLGTIREALAGVFHVASRVDATIGIFQCRSDMKFRIGRVGLVASF